MICFQYLSSFALTPEEIRVLCNHFIAEYDEKIQMSIFRKQMNKIKESVDDYVCNEIHFCPNGWSRYQIHNLDDNSYMEEEL